MYCRVITKVLIIKAASVLVEDDDGIVELAVYGLQNPGDLSVGRRLAISEPYFKTRQDGSKGIRVDNAADISFDVSEPVMSSQERLCKRLSLEERLKQIVREDNTMGVNRIYQTLVEEGYSVKKKQIRNLRAALQKQPNEDTITILSQRFPEKYQLMYHPLILTHRKAGNEAFRAGDFEKAEQEYSAALKVCKDASTQKGEESVALWQLHGNRCAALLRLGKLDEAFLDSLKSNMCAPAEEAKPILRCAEVLMALGLKKESNDLLDAAAAKFPNESKSFSDKKHRLRPKSSLRVGKDKEYKSIAEALQVALPGSEILVDPGIYRDPLMIDGPVTIRAAIDRDDGDALDALENNKNESTWVEINVTATCAILANVEPINEAVRIIGCKVICDALVQVSMHAVYVRRGLVLLRNCFVSSSSGPVVFGQHKYTRVIIHSSVVAKGAQGGILVADHANISMHQVHCCHNAASGVEFRDGGEGTLEACHFYDNGRQGILVWKQAGRVVARDCRVFSQAQESGVMVSQGMVHLENCHVFGNNAAGIVSQRKGNLVAFKCEVHDNLDGILIQDTGCARVEKCDVHSNRANGIFVGFDHQASASITDNKVKNNHCRGILVGNMGKIVVRGNEESGNRGMPPMMPGFLKDRGWNDRAGRSSKYFKNIKKNAATISKAAKEQKPCGLIDKKLSDLILNTTKEMEKMLFLECAFCKAMPENKKFDKCSKCGVARYCSKECQHAHWPQHKTKCKPKPAKYPAFVDQTMNV